MCNNHTGLRRFFPENLIPAFAFPAYLCALCGLCGEGVLVAATLRCGECFWFGPGNIPFLTLRLRVLRFNSPEGLHGDCASTTFRRDLFTGMALLVIFVIEFREDTAAHPHYRAPMKRVNPTRFR